MSMNKETNKNHTTAIPPDDETQGRTHNSQHPDVENGGEQQDISAVDQQEGNLKHGETGGTDFGHQQQSPSA
jgi:hypothetical protein